MQVKAYVRFEDEVDVEVDPREVMDQLGNNDGWGPQRIVAQCHSFMAAVTDEEISKMKPAVRAAIMDGLRVQADRYDFLEISAQED